MKLDFLNPHQLQSTVGGDNNPGCWDNPDDDNGEPLFPGGPTIFVPGFPPFGG